MAPTITSLLYRDYIQPYKRYILTLVLIVIFGLAGFYAFKWFAKPTIDNMSADNVANANFRGGEVQLYIFVADWCPHCRKAKPEWNSFVTAYNGKTINGHTIQCNTVDCTDGTNPLIQKYQIQGYPTMIMMKGGERVDFDSKITQDNLTNFVNTTLGSK